MPTPAHTVIICGDSLILAGLEANLRSMPDVQVLHLPVQAAQAGMRLPADGVVVYDLSETEVSQMAVWLDDCPNLTLLGLDAEHDCVHVLTGQSRSATAVGDLTRLIVQVVQNQSVLDD